MDKKYNPKVEIFYPNSDYQRDKNNKYLIKYLVY